LTPSGGARSVICRIVESFKVTFKFGDVTANKRADKGKKRAGGVPAASVATAVDIRGKEGGALPAKRSNISLLEEAMYAMGALAGDPLMWRTWPGAQPNLFLRNNTAAPPARGLHLYKLHEL
jgi:hypothetical protein